MFLNDLLLFTIVSPLCQLFTFLVFLPLLFGQQCEMSMSYAIISAILSASIKITFLHVSSTVFLVSLLFSPLIRSLFFYCIAHNFSEILFRKFHFYLLICGCLFPPFMDWILCLIFLKSFFLKKLTYSDIDVSMKWHPVL